MMGGSMKMEAATVARVATGGALVLFLCWQHVEATRLGYRCEKERDRADKLRGHVAALRQDLDARLSPMELSRRARVMGLIPAGPDSQRLLPDPDASGMTLIARSARVLAAFLASTRS